MFSCKCYKTHVEVLHRMDLVLNGHTTWFHPAGLLMYLYACMQLCRGHYHTNYTFALLADSRIQSSSQHQACECFALGQVWPETPKSPCNSEPHSSMYLCPIMLSCINDYSSFYLGWFLRKWVMCVNWSISKRNHLCPPSGTSSLHLHLSRFHFPLPHHSSVTLCHFQSGSCFPAVLPFFSCCPFKLSPSHHLSPSALCSSFVVFIFFFLFLCLPLSLFLPPRRFIMF